MAKELVTTNAQAIASPPSDLLAAAVALPQRDLPAIVDQIRSVAISDPRLARSCIWVRTVGKKDGRDQFKLGASVRLSELAHQQLGMIWLSPPRIEETDKSVTATVMAFDLKQLNVTPGVGSKPIVGRNGRFSDTQIELIKSACTSIAKREAILGLWRAQIESIMDDIKQAIIADLCPEGSEVSMKDAWESLKEQYTEVGVSEQQMKDAVVSERDNANKLVLLIGILNAIRDGAVTVHGVFGGLPSSPISGGDTQNEKQKINERQRYNDLALQMTQAGLGDDFNAIVIEAQKTSKKTPSKWNDAQLQSVNDALASTLNASKSGDANNG